MTDVTVIKIEKKKTNYVAYTSVGDYKFDSDTLVKYGIFKDRTFTKLEFDNILKDNDINVAYNKAIKYLSYGPRSKCEIIKYLKAKEVTCVDKVIQKLIDTNYIDDLKIASSIVNYYKESNKGPNVIKKKLQEKGFDEKIIEEVLSIYSNEEEEAKAFKIANKEIENMTSYPIKKQKTSLYQKLISKGFSYSIASKVVEKVEYTDDSYNSLVKDYEKAIFKYKELDSDLARKKVLQKLLTKGYDYKDIKEVMNDN